MTICPVTKSWKLKSHAKKKVSPVTRDVFPSLRKNPCATWRKKKKEGRKKREKNQRFIFFPLAPIFSFFFFSSFNRLSSLTIAFDLWQFSPIFLYFIKGEKNAFNEVVFFVLGIICYIIRWLRYFYERKSVKIIRLHRAVFFSFLWELWRNCSCGKLTSWHAKFFITKQTLSAVLANCFLLAFGSHLKIGLNGQFSYLRPCP